MEVTVLGTSIFPLQYPGRYAMINEKVQIEAFFGRMDRSDNKRYTIIA